MLFLNKKLEHSSNPSILIYSGQFLPASERCDDPLLAVLESPSIVQLLLDQIFMHTKSSLRADGLKTSQSISEQPISKNDSSVKVDTSEVPASEEDDAGGGKHIKYII